MSKVLRSFSNIALIIVFMAAIADNLWLNNLPLLAYSIPILLAYITLRCSGQLFRPNKYFFCLLLLAASTSLLQILHGFDEYLKHIIIIFFLVFAAFLAYGRYNLRLLLVAISTLYLASIFLPDQFFLHPKVYYEYEILPRVSLFAQNTNLLATSITAPLVIASFRYPRYSPTIVLVSSFCLFLAIPTFSRTIIFITLILFLMNIKPKYYLLIPLFLLSSIWLGSNMYPEMHSASSAWDLHSILYEKLQDLADNPRYYHLKHYLDQDLYLYSFKDGTVPSLGNIHNQFLAFPARFGIPGFICSFSLLFFICLSIRKSLVNCCYYQLVVTCLLSIPLFFFDLTLNLYLYVFFYGLLDETLQHKASSFTFNRP